MSAIYCSIFLVDIHLVHHLAGPDDLLRRRHGCHRGHAALDVLTDDELLLLQRGIADDHLQHETVDLGLGQLVGALLLDGVLRGQHQEGVGQLEGAVADGHLMLLHSLEQGTLHLGRGTVDLVGQYEVGKDGALLHLKVLVFLRIDHRTDDVSRKQVGRELYATMKSASTSSARVLMARVLARPGTPPEDVAVAEQRMSNDSTRCFCPTMTRFMRPSRDW
jgi:hypothetical protein